MKTSAKKKRKVKKKFNKFKFILLSLLCFLFPIKLTNQTFTKNRIPLGRVRVTKYTHFEGGRTTASGHYLKDTDSHKICAIGRDWWKKDIPIGTKIWVEGFSYPLTVLDTMAIKNHKGLLQTRWVDIYHNNVKEALNFGIQWREASIETN